MSTTYRSITLNPADTGDTADIHICRCRDFGVEGAHDDAGPDDTVWRLGCSGYGSYVAEGWNDQYETVMACEASWMVIAASLSALYPVL